MEQIQMIQNPIITNLEKPHCKSNTNVKEELVMNSLVEFYQYEANLNQLLPILLKKSKISLRVLDWFVTNYAKPDDKKGWKGVNYNIMLYGHKKNFSVYDSYKAQLKAFHKKLFDPFCRRRRIYFEYTDDSRIETTAGQLNFFRWAIQNNIIHYVETHFDKIVQHMTLYNKEYDPTITITGEIEVQEDSTVVAKIGFN